LLFGLHNGYTKLRSFYNANNRQIKTKFDLEAPIDYYIIESIYQYVFFGSHHADFEYLDPIINNIPVQKTAAATVMKTASPAVLEKEITYASNENDWARIADELIVKLASLDKVKINQGFRILNKEEAIEDLNRFFRKDLIDVFKKLIKKSESPDTVATTDSSKQTILGVEETKSELAKDKTRETSKELNKTKSSSQPKKDALPKLFENNNIAEIDLEKCSLADLKDIAKKLQIKGCSNYKSADIPKLKQLINSKMNR